MTYLPDTLIGQSRTLEDREGSTNVPDAKMVLQSVRAFAYTHTVYIYIKH